MQLYTYSVCDFIQWVQKKENVCCFAQTGTSIDIERKTGGTGYSVEGVQKNLFIFLLICHTPREQEGNTYYGYYRRLNQTRKDKRIHTAKGGNEVKGRTTGKPSTTGIIPRCVPSVDRFRQGSS